MQARTDNSTAPACAQGSACLAQPQMPSPSAWDMEALCLSCALPEAGKHVHVMGAVTLNPAATGIGHSQVDGTPFPVLWELSAAQCCQPADTPGWDCECRLPGPEAASNSTQERVPLPATEEPWDLPGRYLLMWTVHRVTVTPVTLKGSNDTCLVRRTPGKCATWCLAQDSPMLQPPSLPTVWETHSRKRPHIPREICMDFPSVLKRISLNPHRIHLYSCRKLVLLPLELSSRARGCLRKR